MVQSGKGHLEVSDVCREVAGPAVGHAREWRLDCWDSAVSAVASTAVADEEWSG